MRVHANLKQKLVLGQIRKVLEMMAEQQEKWRQHQDKEMEATCRLADKNLGV